VPSPSTSSTTSSLRVVVTTQRGCEKALAKELELLDVPKTTRDGTALAFDGDATHVARINVFSRVAQRVLVELASGEATSDAQLFDGLMAFEAERFIGPTDTFAVTGHLGEGACLDHSHFAALRVKDAVVDRFRDKGLPRPLIDTHAPSIRFVLYLAHGRFSLALDTSDEPLHKRGYRREEGEAPLKENLAAAILAIGHADVRRPFVDPTCGSGTLVIEQALRALDRAPGMSRPFAIERAARDALSLKPALRRAREEARDRQKHRLDVEIRGSDWHPKAIAAITANIAAVGLTGQIVVEQVDARKAHLDVPGVVVAANLPFGERLGKGSALQLDGFYRTLGDTLRSLSSARVLLFTAHPRAERLLDVGEVRRTSLPSAKIPSMLLRYDVGARPPRREREEAGAEIDPRS